MGQIPKGCDEDKIVLKFVVLSDGKLKPHGNMPHLGICGTYGATTIYLCKRCQKKYDDAFPLLSGQHYPLGPLSATPSGKV